MAVDNSLVEKSMRSVFGKPSVPAVLYSLYTSSLYTAIIRNAGSRHDSQQRKLFSNENKINSF